MKQNKISETWILISPDGRKWTFKSPDVVVAMKQAITEIEKSKYTCLECFDEKRVRYYYDAGNHFGAGTSPNSGWR